MTSKRGNAESCLCALLRNDTRNVFVNIALSGSRVLVSQPMITPAVWNILNTRFPHYRDVAIAAGAAIPWPAWGPWPIYIYDGNAWSRNIKEKGETDWPTSELVATPIAKNNKTLGKTLLLKLLLIKHWPGKRCLRKHLILFRYDDVVTQWRHYLLLTSS